MIPVLVVAAGLYLLLRWYAKGQVFYPTRYPDGLWSSQASLGADDVWLETGDGVRLHGWFAEGQSARVITVFFHGNGGNLSYRTGHVAEITAAGSDLLMIDYRGYGRSEGSPSETGLYADAEAAWQFAAKRGKPIVLQGESLGTAVAIELATHHPPAAMILEAPFTSVRAMAARVFPVVGPLFISGYDSLARIGKVKAPLLVIHGDRDTIVPLDLGRELFKAAPKPKEMWVVPGADHNDLPEVAGPAYRERLREFYQRL